MHNQSCYCCGESQRDFNNIDILKGYRFVIKSEAYNVGISSMHALMRSMEFFLRLSYKQVIGKGRATAQEEKNKVAERKREAKKLFWERPNLVIDSPRQGSGTSNT